MAQIPNPQSELLREPNLLVPGKQPIGNTKLAPGLKFYCACLPKDWADKSRLITGSLIGGAVIQGGRLITDGSTKQHFEAFPFIGASGAYNQPTYPFTIIVRTLTYTDGVGQVFHSTGRDGGSIYEGVYLRIDPGGSTKIRIGSANGAGPGDRADQSWDSSADVGFNEMHTQVHVVKAPASGLHFIDGKEYTVSYGGSYSGQPESDWWLDEHGPLVGGGYGNKSDYQAYGGETECLFVIDESIPDAFARDLSVDPYQLLIPA